MIQDFFGRGLYEQARVSDKHNEKKHSPHTVDGCSAGIHMMATRDSELPSKHVQIKY
jgi:hypothetical protein